MYVEPQLDLVYTAHMSINPEVKIGHVHLTVSDLEKSLAFYQGILGFEITQWYGTSAVFLSAAHAFRGARRPGPLPRPVQGQRSGRGSAFR